MSILTDSSHAKQAAEIEACRRTYRSKEELAMRGLLEEFCRGRWPNARVVHELVMGNGKVRADMAAISLEHFNVFEIKGPYDDTNRLMHQIGTYRLAAPDVWLVTAGTHNEDGELMRHLLPSIGHIHIHGIDSQRYGVAPDPAQVRLEVIAEPADFTPLPRAMLALLWSEELAAECNRARLMQIGSRRPTCRAMIDRLLTLPAGDITAAVCRQLRGRNAFWRADPPILES